ncbi:arylamine N-acetyltransferase [Actinokineospora auranticolor]|uniref:N-hydroxyarylamine O-acetyltransferase n=1 Tax=Actinokineospora auranticolor TaxID=155976 RepID=A0A2S6H0K6_9PSEU|nr:arylamine N-acetyltransferase [Actinokineospora auranticolor]PPK71003.1 N-hydroxyarylamine O-acetyltransferase [Actinokineospora auranticolor]
MDEWQSDRLDLDAYLERIGVTGDLPVSPATLTRVNRAHALSLPFENLDVVLGRGVDVDLDAIQAKLVRGGRGGYCYEQNLLYGAAVERLGFTVTRLIARTDLDAPRPRPRTHMTLLVHLDGGTYLTDVGFGNDGPTEPVPLVDGAEVVQSGTRYRVTREPAPGRWLLARHRVDHWFPLYRFTDEPHHQVDVVVANHFISTHPRSPFVGRVYLGRITDDWRLNLNDRVLTLVRPDGAEERSEVTDAEVPALLRERFGLRLSAEDTAKIVAALP